MVIMALTEISEKYEAYIATVANYPDWVRTKAREIDLETELNIAETFDRIMKTVKAVYPFAGVSSNNMFWNLTVSPVRLIYIPLNDGEYITLINPNILKLEGEDIDSVEGCASVPDNQYMVKRKPVVRLGGYTLQKKYSEIEYKSEIDRTYDGPVLLSYQVKGFIVQHEMDHLEGITIKDKGSVFDLNSLMEGVTIN